MRDSHAINRSKGHDQEPETGQVRSPRQKEDKIIKIVDPKEMNMAGNPIRTRVSKDQRRSGGINTINAGKKTGQKVGGMAREGYPPQEREQAERQTPHSRTNSGKEWDLQGQGG